MNKITITITAIVALFVGIVLGHSFYPSTLGGASSTGATFGSAKYAGITMSLATAGTNGTSSSISNADANTRLITGLRVGCQGLGTSETAYVGGGLIGLSLKVGTTSATAPGLLNSFANVASTTIATSTSAYVLASSTTQLATSSYAAVWGTGENLSFVFNATNTGVCTVGVDYIGT